MQKSLIISLSLTIIPISLTYLIKKIYQKLPTNPSYKDSYFYKFIFVTFRNRICASHVNSGIECGSKCSLRYLQNVLSCIALAKQSLSICIYHLTLEQITDAIIDAHKRGVKVRCITDNVMISCSGSKWENIKNAGIPVKIQSKVLKSCMLHHKFFIVDEDHPKNRKLLFGSINYTMQGFVCNWDHIICTNNTEILTRYKEEFDEMWEEMVFF